MPTSHAEIRWVTATALIRANMRIVSLTGETHRVRDRGLLESAVAAPRQLNHYSQETDPVALAVRLLRAVGKNHPFEQGNKRTAFDGAVAFMLVNGVHVDLPDSEETAEQVLRLIVGEAEETDLVSYLRPYCTAHR